MNERFELIASEKLLARAEIMKARLKFQEITEEAEELVVFLELTKENTSGTPEDIKFIKSDY